MRRGNIIKHQPVENWLVWYQNEKAKKKKNAVFINQNYHLVGTTYIICNSVTNTPHVNNSHNFFFFLFFFFQKHTQNPIIYGAIYHFHSRHNTKKLHINFVHTIIMSKGRKIWINVKQKFFHKKNKTKKRISEFANIFKF